MKITAQLKDFLVQQGWAKDTDTDDQIRKVLGEKLLAGELTADKLAELTKDSAPAPETVIVNIVKQQLDAALAPVLAKLNTTQTPPPEPPAKDTRTDVEKAVESAILKMTGGQGMVSLLSRSADVLERPIIRVKSAVESYSHNRKAAIYPDNCGISGTGTKHPFAGRPASYAGIPLEIPSERDKAISAAYFKFALSKAHDNRDVPRRLWMSDHDKDLLQWAVKNCAWTGYLDASETEERGGRVDRRKLTDLEQKALLDDTVSGGIEIAPIEFDDAIITTPVLYGELFPLVNVITVARGRRMKGGSLTNPTFTSGVSEGTPIEPFNTASFVSAFDTAIFTAVGAMEIGLDFEEDSPTTIGATVIQKYGEKSLEWLDRVVATGDGVTEPTGIFNTSGITSVTSEFGPNGPPTVNDYEALMFTVAKQFRNTKGSRNVFIGNDVSYRRFRSIPVGPGDERRVSGMDYVSYTALEHPYKIQNDVTNPKIAFANLGYYRMYRRLGLNIRMETAGQALALRNTRLIVVRMRWGGKLELAGAAAVMTTAQN